jgi:hypothetical protein
MRLAALAAVCLLAALPLRAVEATFTRATVAPMKTSIYIGSVTLSTGAFERAGDTWSTTYNAKVFPWFPWSEHGEITIMVTDANLARLAKGETVEFTGDAKSHKGKPRKVTGRAQPANDHAGKIKVRIHVDDVELIFNGSYELTR